MIKKQKKKSCMKDPKTEKLVFSLWKAQKLKKTCIFFMKGLKTEKTCIFFKKSAENFEVNVKC
jgi:IS1 family transposase